MSNPKMSAEEMYRAIKEGTVEQDQFETWFQEATSKAYDHGVIAQNYFNSMPTG